MNPGSAFTVHLRVKHPLHRFTLCLPLRFRLLPPRSLHVALLPCGALVFPRGTLHVEHLPHPPPPYAIAGTTTTAMSVLVQAMYNPSSTSYPRTSTSSTPAYRSSAYPSSTYPMSMYPAYAAPLTTTQHHHAQQRLTLVILSPITSNATSNANSTSFHTMRSGLAYRINETK
ncbi:hypothetical protein C8J57DRAFT_1615057 [Mycena rebaudengoi]|nr:hypothetical protein C8J57DRAFT_1615057 [Mycena rebaudengoi]